MGKMNSIVTTQDTIVSGISDFVAAFEETSAVTVKISDSVQGDNVVIQCDLNTQKSYFWTHEEHISFIQNFHMFGSSWKAISQVQRSPRALLLRSNHQDLGLRAEGPGRKTEAAGCSQEEKQEVVSKGTAP